MYINNHNDQQTQNQNAVVHFVEFTFVKLFFTECAFIESNNIQAFGYFLPSYLRIISYFLRKLL